MSDLPIDGQSTALHRLRRKSQQALLATGQIMVGSGQLVGEGLLAGAYTHVGATNAEKQTNQDYVLGWAPDAVGESHGIAMVIAMADGVTAAFRAEWASQIACWTAIRELSIRPDGEDPRISAEQAFLAATEAITEIAREVLRDQDRLRPPGEFDATWAYRLRKGRLLQTTLLLVWLDRNTFRIASVGDAGVVWRAYGSGIAPPQDHIVAHCDLDTCLVNALGPFNPRSLSLDYWCELPRNEHILCVFYTDGIGRALGSDPTSILEDMDVLLNRPDNFPPQTYIERALADRPEIHDDNVSLAFIRTV